MTEKDLENKIDALIQQHDHWIMYYKEKVPKHSMREQFAELLQKTEARKIRLISMIGDLYARSFDELKNEYEEILKESFGENPPGEFR